MFKQTLNPSTGNIEGRVIIDGKILLHNHDVEECIMMYFTKYKEAEARKIYYIIVKAFCRVTERKNFFFLGFLQSEGNVWEDVANNSGCPITNERSTEHVEESIPHSPSNKEASSFCS